MAQEAAYTSVHQIPSFFKSNEFEKIVEKHNIRIILDVGGGKYDDATLFLKHNKDIINLVYDPFNRPLQENEQNLTIFQDVQVPKKLQMGAGIVDDVNPEHSYKMVTCLNVLNVIRDDIEMDGVIKFCAKQNCPAVFQIYQGDRSGRKSTKTVQRNQKTKDYVALINKHFGYVVSKGNFIFAYHHYFSSL
jgi:hypothetical protein